MIALVAVVALFVAVSIAAYVYTRVSDARYERQAIRRRAIIAEARRDERRGKSYLPVKRGTPGDVNTPRALTDAQITHLADIGAMDAEAYLRRLWHRPRNGDK